jgi:uncharacterized protein (DUF427 family)
VAETRRPQLIFETGLPVRYYILTEDVRMDLLEPSETKSRCAYKGEASYRSLRVGGQVYPDVAWYYLEPLTLVKPVAGPVAFFQERVERVFVDGEQIERPDTPWAR